MKVCILAAGLGARSFNPSVHKALLPLGNKAVISRIIEQFPEDSHFVLAVGHNADSVRDFLKLAHPDLKISFVTVSPYEGPGSGPGFSLLQCADSLQEPFYFTSCDTLVAETPPKHDFNWMGVSDVADPLNWCTVEVEGAAQIKSIHYKNSKVDRLAFVGLAFVKNYSEFWQGLREGRQKPGEVQVNDGLGALVDRDLRAVKLTWSDTGSVEGYKSLLPKYDKNFSFEGKTTELTYKYGNVVLKLYSSAEAAKIRFDRAKKVGKPLLQPMSLSGSTVSFPFVEGPLLSATLNGETCLEFLNFLQTSLWKDLPVDPEEFKSVAHAFYVEKSQKRVHDFFKLHPDLAHLAQSKIKINGLMCDPPSELISQTWAVVKDHLRPSTFHGDLHGDNVILSSQGPVLIDWRDSFGTSTAVGDRNYDLAKFLHTLYFSVHAMTTRGFKIITESEMAFSTMNTHTKSTVNAAIAFSDFLKARGYHVKSVELLNGLVFLNMAPLYDKDLGFYLYLIGLYNIQMALRIP